MQQAVGVEGVRFSGEHEGCDTGFFERLVDFFTLDTYVRDEESASHLCEVTDEAPVPVRWDFARVATRDEVSGFGALDVITVFFAERAGQFGTGVG